MILVAGECLVDLLVDEAGQAVARLGGGPFNAARGLARLGQPCALAAAVSTDRFGREIRGALAEAGVDDRCLVETPLPTTLALAEVDDVGAARYAFYTAGTSAPALRPGDVAARLPSQVSALLVGTLGLVLEPLASAVEALVAAADDETLVMVDPNCRPGAVGDEDAYRGRLGRVLARADVVKASTEDLAFLAPGGPAEDAARSLLTGRTRCVLVTDGGGPVLVLTPAASTQVAPPRVPVVDTVGAGDAFCAGYLAWWAERGGAVADVGEPSFATQAATFAAGVAAVTCTRQGADPPRRDELPR